MGDTAALDGMARALLRHGVTSFLPSGVSAPLPTLAAFTERVRRWMPVAPDDGAAPLGFNLEGPFLADAKRGAHDPAMLRRPRRRRTRPRSSRCSTACGSSPSRRSGRGRWR